MTKSMQALLDQYLTHAHRDARVLFDASRAAEWQQPDMAPVTRTALRLRALLEAQAPAGVTDRILLRRTVTGVPGIFTDAELRSIRKTHHLHELGNLSNICPDYASVIAVGLEAIRAKAQARRAQCAADGDTEGGAFLDAVLLEIEAVYAFCDRYRAAAQAAGNTAAAERLRRIPRQPAQSFADYLQFFRILHYMAWAEGEYHMTVGRFDQDAWPYLARDLASGALTEADALDLLEEFFLTFNWDSDLYPGVQQGDDGQSLMLGGLTADGGDAFNLLSSMCLTASRELKLIDPKINLRVNANTPLERFEEGTRLTQAGLGFPQYSNDDVVIPALIAKGYDPADARNYTVAACWEFIIPGCGMDINNAAGLSMPKVVNRAMTAHLAECADFDAFRQYVRAEMRAECDRLAADLHDLYIFPAPFVSLMMDGCIDRARDTALGGKYNNFGFHGTGVSTAADSMAAIHQAVFVERLVSAETLIRAVQADFVGFEELQARLRNEIPKMGNDDDRADGEAVFLLDAFADALDGRTNERGGVFRAGTGSAMFYLAHAAETPATADGRSHGEPFGANYSPSLYAKTGGPVSIVRSFTKPHLERTCNGGPLTMEFDGSLFRDAESIRKVAQLVQYFVRCGGHQFQLNAVDPAAMRDAQLHPEKYPRLVVRIWGWSAYFVELDRAYQDHVIARQEYGL